MAIISGVVLVILCVLSAVFSSPTKSEPVQTAELHTIEYVLTNQTDSGRSVIITVVREDGEKYDYEPTTFPANNSWKKEFEIPVGTHVRIDVWSPQGVLGITCAINDKTSDQTLYVEVKGTEDNFRICKAVVK